MTVPAPTFGLSLSADLTLFLTMGMVAVVNPCGFAMLPAYLSYFLGLDEDEDVGGTKDIARADGARTAATAAAGAGNSGNVATATAARGEGSRHPASTVTRAVQVALVVSAGFMTVFALAGLIVSHTSLPVFEYAPWLSILIGIALVALGVAMVAGFELIARLPKLDRGGRQRTMRSMYVFGVSYAIASIGCTLPIFLSGAVASTMRRESVADGLVAFAAYAAGMAVVLTALTVALALARTSLVTALRSSRRYVNPIAGVLVALAGVYVAFYGVLELRTYRAGSPGEIPSSSLTSWVADRSYDVTDWVNRVGAGEAVLWLAALTLVAGVIATLVRRRSPA